VRVDRTGRCLFDMAPIPHFVNESLFNWTFEVRNDQK
jgi:hypothetical protein